MSPHTESGCEAFRGTTRSAIAQQVTGQKNVDIANRSKTLEQLDSVRERKMGTPGVKTDWSILGVGQVKNKNFKSTFLYIHS